MPTLTENYINDLKINKPTRTQLNNATTLSSDELYLENPEFLGGKLLATDADGDIVESDDTPTVIQALSATDSITLTDAVLYQGGEQTSLTIALPASATVGFVSQVSFLSGNTATAITYPSTGLVWHHRGDDVSDGVFTPVANKVYMIVFVYDGYQFIAFVEGTNYAS